MRQALIKYNGIVAGQLTETDEGEYVFQYDTSYIERFPKGYITFNMPVQLRPYTNKRLFPFFDGLIPEGWLLNIAAESWKINKNDRMGLLLACCSNAIGAVTIHQLTPEGNE